jgi:hypothetical protein
MYNVFTQIIYTSTLKAPKDILSDLSGLRGTTHVRAEESALRKVGINSLVDHGSGLLLAKELKHESNRAKSRDRVGDVLALNVRRGTVARLAHGETVTDVGRGHETEGADESGSAVGENVAVEVGGDDHVVCGGLAEELVDHRVDDLLLDLDAGVPELGLLEGFAGGGAEQAVGLRQHVALVCDGDDGALGGVGAGAVADALSPGRDLAGHVGDAVAGALGDALDGLGDLAVGTIVGLLLLDVQVLGVLADDDEVDRVGECGGGSDGLDGPHVGVQVQALAEADDGAAVALGRGRRRAAIVECKQAVC